MRLPNFLAWITDPSSSITHDSNKANIVDIIRWTAVSTIGTTLTYGAGSVLMSLVKRKCTMKLELTSKDDAFAWLVYWVSEQPFMKNVKHVNVLTQSYSTADYFGGGYNPTEKEKHKKPIKFIPASGTHFFRYRRHLVWMHYSPANSTGNQASTGFLTITVLGRDRQLLEHLIKEAQELYLERNLNKTVIYVPDLFCDVWDQTGTMLKRKPETVILRDKIMDELIADAKEFLESERWYAERGIPFRRGYLLYGPPGTGKTSTVMALAGELDLNICLCNLSSMSLTDEKLIRLLHEAPRNSLILLEDIDCAFSAATTSSSGGRGGGGGGGGVSRRARPPMILSEGDDLDEVASNRSDQRLTLSGLLNSIDGVAAQEGRLLFMTTNHKEKLKYALIRPGRVDYEVLIDYADEDQVKRLFCKFYSDVEKEHDVPHLAEIFVSKIRGLIGTVTTAHIQSHLLRYKKAPERAIDAFQDLFAHYENLARQQQQQHGNGGGGGGGGSSMRSSPPTSAAATPVSPQSDNDAVNGSDGGVDNVNNNNNSNNNDDDKDNHKLTLSH